MFENLNESQRQETIQLLLSQKEVLEHEQRQIEETLAVVYHALKEAQVQQYVKALNEKKQSSGDSAHTKE